MNYIVVFCLLFFTVNFATGVAIGKPDDLMVEVNMFVTSLWIFAMFFVSFCVNALEKITKRMLMWNSLFSFMAVGKILNLIFYLTKNFNTFGWIDVGSDLIFFTLNFCFITFNYDSNADYEELP